VLGNPRHAASDAFFNTAGGNVDRANSVEEFLLGRTAGSNGDQYWDSLLTALLNSADAGGARFAPALEIASSGRTIEPD